MLFRKRTRRGFLSALGAGAAAAPFVPLLDSHAEGEAAPCRLVVFYHPHGVAYPNWLPSGTENNWTLSPILQPLAPFKSDLVVIDGLNNEAAYSAKGGFGNGHQRGVMSLLTGFEVSSQVDAGGPSLDQVVAAPLAEHATFGTAKYASLEFAIRPRGSRISAVAANEPLNPEDDPYEAFNRVFGDFGAGEEELLRLKAERRTVADFVRNNLERVDGQVAPSDRQKIERHLEAIGDIEAQIESLGLYPAGCQLPVLDPGINAGSYNDYPEAGQAMIDVLVGALACDLTRVATFQYGSSGNTSMNHSWQGITTEYHELAHNCGGGQQNGIDRMTDMCTWYAEQLAYLLAGLAAVPEGDGTLLDNTLVLWVTSMANGSHNWDNMPFVLAGGAGGNVATDRFLEFSGRPHNDLLAAAAQAVGVDVSSFGDPDYFTGVLPGIV